MIRVGKALLPLSLTLYTASLQAQHDPKLQVPAVCPSSVDVLTHRYTSARTGANLCETALTPDNVTRQGIGLRFSYPVLGQVYAQPLIATRVPEIRTARGTTEHNKNLAIVATMQNFVYAFDADGGNTDEHGVPQAYWRKHLGPPLPVNRIPRDIGAFLGHFNISPYIGITSTPVIDPGKTTVFLVAKIATVNPLHPYCDTEVATPDCPVVNRIVALDLATGDVRDALDIELPKPEDSQTMGDDPHPCGFLDGRKPTEYDAGRINMQRPALLLTGTSDLFHLYLGFGSHQDAPCPMYHGMLLRIDYAKGKLTKFPRTFLVSQIGDLGPKDPKHPHDPTRLGMGGVWQAGNGPVADDDGNVYIMTGNGGFDPDRRFGSNFVKLSPDLQPMSWFAPWNVHFLNDGDRDIDLGASGPVLLPGSGQIVGGGKQGKLYLLNQEPLGGKQKFGWPIEHKGPPVQVFWAARRWAPEFIYRWAPISLFAFATGYHHIHGAPAFWGEPDPDGVLRHGSLYVWPERDNLKAFTYQKVAGTKAGIFNTSPSKKGPSAGMGMPGGFLSITANSTPTTPQNDLGILWAALPLHDDAWIDIVPGALRAFAIRKDGSMLHEIWTSYCAEPKDLFDFAKYVPPTVANGYVYLATFSNAVRVYGLLPAGSRREPQRADPGCPVSTIINSANYPHIKDPKGIGYSQNSRAAKPRPR